VNVRISILGERDVESHEDGGNDEMAHAHRNAPQADPACLYGLIGDVARAGGEGPETSACAIAANFMAY
jgi:putative DNA primase/helicase